MAEAGAPEWLREAVITDSEFQLRLLLGTQAVWETDADGVVVADSPSWRAYTGQTVEEWLGYGWLDAIHPNDRAHAERQWREAVAARRLVNADFRLRAPDGGWRWTNVRAVPVLDAEGRVGKWAGLNVDIDSRKRAEAALRESEEFNRRILAASADCIKVLDLDGRLEFMSEGGMCVMEVEDFGAIRGACWPDFWAGEGHEQARAAVAEAKHGGIGRFQGYATTMKGDPRWWDVIVSPINGADGRPERLLSVSRDVTATRAAEQRLRESEERLRDLNQELETQVAARTGERNQLWNLSREIMLRCRTTGEILTVNPAWGEVLGWREEELVGKTIFDFIHPDDLQHTREGARVHAEGGSFARFENRYRTRDGDYRWIDWSTSPAGDVILAVGRDATADKEAADALARTEEALRQAHKMEAVGQLTGGLAHDFNNLLAGISGALELMELRIGQGRLRDVEKYVAAAQGAAKRAAALTHRLLAFSRRQTLLPKPVDVNRLAADMLDLIQRTVGPGIAVENVAGAGLWTALVDPSQLENALLNLCINARDAMPDGGRLTIETCNRWIDRRTGERLNMPEGQYLSLCVSDTGVGMPPGVIEKAFDPFFTTKPIGEGTGLGLSMIYGFAKQSGGQVRIHSTVGQGTTVCIHLPRHAGEAETEDPQVEGAITAHAEAGETVLVVDDEPTVRLLVTEVLDELGYGAIEASDSAAGLRVLQSGARVDLLISDVGLPGGMNGRQMADAARATRPDLKVLFITGFAENALLDGGRLASGMAVLTKPFAADVLAARVRELVGAGSSR